MTLLDGVIGQPIACSEAAEKDREELGAFYGVLFRERCAGYEQWGRELLLNKLENA